MLQAPMTTPLREAFAPPVPAGGALFDDTASLRLVVRSVIACVLGVSKDHPDVEDCTHEALSRALEGKDRLRKGEPLQPWVLGIARHVALDALRRRKRQLREQVVESPEADASTAWIERVADPAPGPEERAASAERGRRLQEAMARLPGDQRRALVMFHVDGLGYQEIAKNLGVPLGTVATWISRGRRAIAEALGE